MDEFLQMISYKLKSPLTKEDIFSETIKIGHLKRIDTVFNKGIHYYLDPKAPEKSKEASIFFRKDKFGTELNIGAKKIVNKFEEFKISLSAIATLAEIETERKIPTFNTKNNPKEIANQVRTFLHPGYRRNLRDFLKAIIYQVAKHNILVFEFVETHNKKEKANIDGFYLNPNVIVLKRNQSFRREIFTLAHELGHYLLDEEEVEKLDYEIIGRNDLSSIERWCNDFAYYFLAGKYSNIIDKLEVARASNDYHFEIIQNISNQTHLSQIALFTRLLYQKKISQSNYRKIKDDFEEQFRLRKEKEKLERQLLKDQGIKQRGSVAKPISSPLLISTVQSAFHEGIISEYEVCKKLNIKADKLDKYI